jgi:hypothetical protein
VVPMDRNYPAAPKQPRSQSIGKQSSMDDVMDFSFYRRTDDECIHLGFRMIGHKKHGTSLWHILPMTNFDLFEEDSQSDLDDVLEEFVKHRQ